MEEAPTPINLVNLNSLEISEKIIFNNQDYDLRIINQFEEQYLAIKLEQINIENCENFHQVKFNIEGLYKLNKYFRQFDTIDEVIKSLKINDKIIKEKGNVSTFNINFENSNLYLRMNLFLMTGEIQSINIKMDKIKRTEKEINNKLKEYIKYIKNIPGVKELILSYENSSMFFPVKSNIITKTEDFKFVYDELCKKLNKNKLKLVQKFNILKDDKSLQNFHVKCDNIGPNLSIIKTSKNLIFGVFTVNNHSGKGVFKKDDLSFLFNFQNKKIYPIKKGDNTAYCSQDRFMDLNNGKGSYGIICIGGNLSGNTAPISDTSYQNFSINYELNNGEQYFNVSEFEVYEVK